MSTPKQVKELKKLLKQFCELESQLSKVHDGIWELTGYDYYDLFDDVMHFGEEHVIKVLLSEMDVLQAEKAEEKRRADALAKLTPEEIKLLGIKTDSDE